MKKTSKSIIAVVLILVCIFSFAAMPISAATPRSFDVHLFDYVSDDWFAAYTLEFLASGEDFVALDINVNLCQDESLGWVSDYITDSNEEFNVYYYVVIKENRVTHTSSGDAETINLNRTREDGGYDLDISVPLYSYSNITRVYVTLYVKRPDSICYVQSWDLTPTEILAQ